MDVEYSQAQVLRQLEERLLQPEVRRSAQAVADLLADEFVEFGSSGRVFDKKQIVAALQEEATLQTSLLDFKTTVLAHEVVLATYRVVRYRASGEQPTHSLRSSIWKLMEGRWQMVFHQGTLSKEP
jgi:hypothetical protein